MNEYWNQPINNNFLFNIAESEKLFLEIGPD